MILHMYEPRTAQVALRLTPSDREELNRRAREAGQSLQEYAISKLLDKTVRFRPGPPPASQRHRRYEQELPLTS